MYLVGFLLVLGPLITVHELGHYLVGRWFGVEAKAFSIGFGSELFGWTDKRGTRWRLAALPLGGYVQFKGDMNPASVPGGVGEEEPEPGSFQSATLWKRALIVASGPVTNILVAIAIFFAFNVIYGKPMPVAQWEKDSARLDMVLDCQMPTLRGSAFCGDLFQQVPTSRGICSVLNGAPLGQVMQQDLEWLRVHQK